MALLVVSSACRARDGADGGGSEESSGAPIDAPAPDFLEPAGGELHVSAMHFDDIELDVAVAVGATEVELDGEGLGTLGATNPIGELSADLLRLRTSGGLVPSVHALQMRTVDLVEVEVSEVVDVFVDAEPAPEIDVVLHDAVVAQADGIVALGFDEDGVLVVVDGETATLLDATAARWRTSETHDMLVPGYVAAPGDRAPAIAVERVGDDLLVAWRVGHPGASIDAVATRWGEEQGEGTTALALDPAWIGPFETASFGRPVIAAGLLIAELRAYVDAEQPRPGDHAIATVRLDGAAQPGMPSRAQLAKPAPEGAGKPTGPVDVDGLAPTLDPLGVVGLGPVALGVRIDDVAAVIDVERSSRTISVRRTATVDSFGAIDEIDGPLVTLLGAFGSRIVTGATTDADVALGLFDDRGPAGVVDASVDPEDLELGAPTGPPAIGLVGGAAVVMVPFGPDAPVLFALVVAADPVLVPIEELRCDAVALPQTVAGNALGALAFACLQARDLRMGAIELH
jgi:hypothetical protein